MRVVVLPVAASEFRDAVIYYEQLQSGLGSRFRDEVNRHIQWIRKNPTLPRIRNKRYRRVNLKVFPYYLAYSIWDNKIWALAIANSYRKPEYWIHRSDNLL